MIQIKIGGKKYTILHTNHTNNKVFKEEEDAHGYIAYKLSEIHIRDTNSKDSMEETTIHEVLHAMLDNSGAPDANLDAVITVLTPRLHAFIIDNPDFFSTLIFNK